MKQVQFFKYSTIALIVFNLLIIGFFLFKAQRPSPPMHGPSGPPHHILDLDKEQEKSFLKFANEHKPKIKNINARQQLLLTKYFSTLYAGIGHENFDSLLTQIQQLERNKIETTYLHFEDIKSIIRPEQQKNYQEFVKNTLQVILKDTRSGTPPPRN